MLYFLSYFYDPLKHIAGLEWEGRNYKINILRKQEKTVSKLLFTYAKTSFYSSILVNMTSSSH